MQFNRTKGFTQFGNALLYCDLPLFEKVILGVIASYERRGLPCTATNEHWIALGGKCSEATVTRALASLAKRKLIETNGSRNGRRLSLTEAAWALAELAGGSEGEDAPPPPTRPAKPKKERKAKHPTIDEHCAMELPDWLQPEVWRAFVEYRHKDKGPFTENTAKGVIRQLSNLRSEGHDPRKLIELAVDRGWLIPYADKDGRTKSSSGLTGDVRRGKNGEMIVPGEGVYV